MGAAVPRMLDPMSDTSPDTGHLAELERRIEQDRVRRDGWTLFIFAFAALALLASIVSVGLGLRPEDGAGASNGGTETIEIELGDLYVRPASIDVAAGTEVILKVTNNGAMAHDLRLEGETGTDLLDPGATQEVSLGVIDATSQAWCTVPGHKEAGMVLDINVAGTAAPAQDAESGGGADDGAVIDFAAEPAPDFQPYDPTLAPAPGGTEHTVTFKATETVMEVAPGVTQELWTFNDQVPGPVLHGRVGDIFTITLVNDGKLGHSIDFHASKVAWNDEMRTIEPGESLVYQFEAKYAGVFMYHCGTAPALHHIGNGMFGAVIIDPPDLAPVDHEYVFVQSELYLGPEGQPGDLTKMQNEELRRRRVQRLRQPVQAPPDPGGAGRAGAGVGPRRRPQRELGVPHRRAPSSTPSSRKAPTCSSPTPAGAARRRSTCSPPRAGSSRAGVGDVHAVVAGDEGRARR